MFALRLGLAFTPERGLRRVWIRKGWKEMDINTPVIHVFTLEKEWSDGALFLGDQRHIKMRIDKALRRRVATRLAYPSLGCTHISISVSGRQLDRAKITPDGLVW